MTSSHTVETVRDAYLAWLSNELRLLPVIPIKSADRVTRLPLEEVYVQLRVLERAQVEAFQRVTKGEFAPDEEYRRRTEALEKMERTEGVFLLLSDTQLLPRDERRRTQPVSRLVLIGDAGSGKTTTLHHGALVLAEAWRQRDGTRVATDLDLHADPLPMPVY